MSAVSRILAAVTLLAVSGCAATNSYPGEWSSIIKTQDCRVVAGKYGNVASAVSPPETEPLPLIAVFFLPWSGGLSRSLRLGRKIGPRWSPPEARHRRSMLRSLGNRVRGTLLHSVSSTDQLPARACATTSGATGFVQGFSRSTSRFHASRLQARISGSLDIGR
jgi:hypothetical protein